MVNEAPIFVKVKWAGLYIWQRLSSRQVWRLSLSAYVNNLLLNIPRFSCKIVKNSDY